MPEVILPIVESIEAAETGMQPDKIVEPIRV